jgi:hypothetical protein
MSQVLRQSTQFVVRIGPAVAVGDGFTPVTTLALGTADEAELLKAAGAATVSIAAATFAAITGADGWYDLTLTTSHTDTIGTLDVVVNDDSLILPIHARFQVIEEAAYDAIYAASAAPATAAGVSAVETKVDTVDTNVDAILVDTGTTLQAELDAIEAAVITNAAGVDIAADIIALKAETAAILADTGTDGVVVAAASKTGYALSAAQTFDLTGSITGNLSGSVGSVTGAVGSVTGAVGSVTGLTASDVGAIKVQTDKLTFSIANQVDATTKAIVATPLTGDGSTTPWGPA